MIWDETCCSDLHTASVKFKLVIFLTIVNSKNHKYLEFFLTRSEYLIHVMPFRHLDFMKVSSSRHCEALAFKTIFGWLNYNIISVLQVVLEDERTRMIMEHKQNISLKNVSSHFSRSTLSMDNIGLDQAGVYTCKPPGKKNKYVK